MPSKIYSLHAARMNDHLFDFFNPFFALKVNWMRRKFHLLSIFICFSQADFRTLEIDFLLVIQYKSLPPPIGDMGCWWWCGFYESRSIKSNLSKTAELGELVSFSGISPHHHHSTHSSVILSLTYPEYVHTNVQCRFLSSPTHTWRMHRKYIWSHSHHSCFRYSSKREALT